MHKIVYDKSKRALIATLSGYIGVEQANEMLSDFKNSVTVINPQEHILIIKPENISASIMVLPILQSFLRLIGQLKFKIIYLVDSDKYASVIKQSLSSYGVSNSVKYVRSINEALKN